MKKKIVWSALIFVLLFELMVYGKDTNSPVKTQQKVNTQKRSPFEATSKNFYNYKKTASTLILKGIITTGKFGRAIFLINGSYSIFTPGDKFNIKVENMQYTFKVKSIKKKSVILKGGDMNSYKVFI